MAVVRAADESAGGEVAVEAVTSEDTPVVESPLESNVVDPTRLEAAVDVPTTGVGDQVLQARDVGATLMQAMGTIGEGTGGSVTISGQKIWKDAEGVKLPDSVTFDLMRGGVKIGTATATAPNWTFSFNISDQPIEGDAYTVGEATVPGFTSEVTQQPDVTFLPPTATGGWTPYEPGNSLDIPLTLLGTQQGVIAMKQGNTWVVWTEDQLSPAEAEVIRQAMYQIPKGGFKGTVTEWIYGAGTYQGFSVDANGAIHFDASNNWSIVFGGAYDLRRPEVIGD